MPSRRLPSPSMVVAITALVLATTGGAVAAVSGIGSSQIRNGSIQAKDLSSALRAQIAEVQSKSVDYNDLSAAARKQLGKAASDAGQQAARTSQAAASQAAAQQALAGAQAQLGALAQQAAGQAALDAVAGKQGPKGDPGASGTVATYTTTASAVHSTGNATYVLATLSLPAGTWALVGHLNGVNNTATSQRLDCFFTGTPDENDLAKFRAQPNTADQVIYADLSLQVVTTLPSATTVKVECAPTGTSPDWTFNSVKLTAVQATGVTRQ